MLFGKSMTEIDNVIKALKDEFEITVGTADMFIGMQIIRDAGMQITESHARSFD